MKIGILTFHNAQNYGAVLQAYALKWFLQRERPSHSVEIVDYKNASIEMSYQYFRPWSSFAHRGARRLASFLLQSYYLFYRVRVRRVFKEFVCEWLEPAGNALSDYDCMVYGSDQIWNPSITGKDLTYLGAGFSGGKIAYAASDGGELVLEAKSIRLLEDFCAISCREGSLSQKLGQYLPEKSVESVCDPVFLLSKEEWLSFAQPPRERDYVLVYKIADNHALDREAERFARQQGKKLVQIVYARNVRKIFCRAQKFVQAITPQQFVGYLAHADLVLTTSFHGTAFSILLERDFYTFQFAHRSGRVVDLLQELGLSDRFVPRLPCRQDGFPEIDWAEVARRKERYRQRSADFLASSLETLKPS